MRGVKYDDLLAIMEFLYLGEANVFQDNMDSFLAFAEELQLKGLMEKTKEKVQDLVEDVKSIIMAETFSPVKSQVPRRKVYKNRKDRTLAIPNNFFGDLVELEDRVKSMMEKSENRIESGVKFADICKVCGKEDESSNIKQHIEAKHLEGVIIPCNLCMKTSSTRVGLRQHKARCHPSSVQ